MKKKFALVLGVIVAVFVLLTLLVATNPLLIFIPLVAIGHSEPMRGATPLIDAHERAITTFVNSEGFGISRFRKSGLWNESSVQLRDQVYDRVEIRLIGLTTEYGPRIYTNDEPPTKEALSAAAHRPLTATEARVIGDLVAGQSKLIALPSDSIDKALSTRVFAPIVMRTECADCHSAEEGAILGAFDYRLSSQQ